MATPPSAYSLLTHEQLIDLTWKDSIVPLLLSRYPNLTPAQLDQARAYAYGGCVIQDLGYYPFGDDVVLKPDPLRTHPATLSSISFAMRMTPTNWPSLLARSLTTSATLTATAEPPTSPFPSNFRSSAAKYGSSVNYAEGKHQHVQTEFAFDINEIAHHRVAPLKYLRHIGLAVSMRQLALAFYQTYGITENFAGRQRINVPRISFRGAHLHSAHRLRCHSAPSQP